MEPDTRKILVVDDESMVRELVAAMLRQYGYDVIQAEDGLTAFEMVQQFRDNLGLVITDIRMPRMDGNQLTTRLRNEYPRIKVLCMSAYADPLSPNGHYFLAKPFTASALMAVVRDVLEVRPAS